jgi:hypothetical protein
VRRLSAVRGLETNPSPGVVWRAATSKADPRQKQDWFLKCLQGGRALPLAILHRKSKPIKRATSLRIDSSFCFTLNGEFGTAGGRTRSWRAARVPPAGAFPPTLPRRKALQHTSAASPNPKHIPEVSPAVLTSLLLMCRRGGLRRWRRRFPPPAKAKLPLRKLPLPRPSSTSPPGRWRCWGIFHCMPRARQTHARVVHPWWTSHLNRCVSLTSPPARCSLGCVWI